jgi:hypothetical protein
MPGKQNYLGEEKKKKEREREVNAKFSAALGAAETANPPQR